MTFNLMKLMKASAVEALCRTCMHVHMQRGLRSEEVIYCNFGWSAPRAIDFVVSECTNYSDRNAAAPAKPIGFVKPSASSEVA